MNYCKLKDFVALNADSYQKNEFPQNIRYLDTGNLVENKIYELQYLNTKENTIPSRAQRKVKINTILYSTVRPNQKHYGIIEKEIKDLVVSTGFVTIDVIDNKLNPKYLFYLLSQQYITDYLHTIAINSVSSYPSISPTDIGNLKIYFPALSTQKAIAKVLSDIDDKIELNNRINKELEEMAKTIYDYWFVQFNFPDENGKPYKSCGGKMVFNNELNREIPEGWEVDLLGSNLEVERGISYKSKEIKENGIPMINLNSFNLNGTYKVGGEKKFSGNFNKQKLVKHGDLLIAVTDVTRNADIIGKSIIIPCIFDDEILISMDVAKIVPNNRLDTAFLNMLFNSQPYHDFVKQFATGTLVLHLDMRCFNFFKLAIPPKHILQKFQKIKHYIEIKKSNILKQNQELARLRDWLLPMLMNGQVTVEG